MYWETRRDEARPTDDRVVLFVVGDYEEAKSDVSDLIEEIGFASVDTGSLAEGGRRQQPGSPIYNEPMRDSRRRSQNSTWSYVVNRFNSLFGLYQLRMSRSFQYSISSFCVLSTLSVDYLESL